MAGLLDEPYIGYPQLRRRSEQSLLGGTPRGLLNTTPEKFDESNFQKSIRNTDWFKEFVKEYKEEPDLNTPEYDYRKAWSMGIRPEKDPYDKNRYHWASSTEEGEMLKSPNHPTAWKEYFMRDYGYNPDEVGITRQMYESMLLK